MIPLFLLVGCNLSYIVDLFAALHELASASARSPMMRALVMCARQLTQAHAKQQTSQRYSSNYSPQVETDELFKRKRKENDLDGKVLCVF